MIKIIILSLVVGASSCGSGTTIAENIQPLPAKLADAVNAIDGKEPGGTVVTFMGLVRAGEVEKAKNLFAQPKKPAEYDMSKGVPTSGVETPGTLDWAGYFRERGFRLGKVVSTQSDEGKAEVKAELRVDDLKDFIQNAVFHLEKRDGRWLISDINLVFDETPVDVVKKLWAAVLDGKQEDWAPFVSYTPASFNNSECPQVQALEKTTGPDEYNAQAPTTTRKDSLYDFTIKKLETINRKKPRLEKLTLHRIKNDEAMVEVIYYDAADNITVHTYALLHREENTWKVFLIAANPELVNPKYAADRCK
ncbi:MAG: hypothetical protein ABI857_02605 [Acidobacteriota bacterium]